MSGPYFIEILASNGDVAQRHRVDTLPATIGRGYDNDVILDDTYTAPRHAVVEDDPDHPGGLQLRDLGSQNGVVHHGKRLPVVPLGGSTIVRLGHTSLRVRSARYPVPAELTDTTMHGWEGAVPALAGLALIALFVAVEQALSDTSAFQAISYLRVIASGLGVGLVWSGVWALVNRLFGGQARMGRHLFILGSGLIAIGAWKVVSNVLAYAWSAESLTRYGNHGTLAIACTVLFFHLRTVKPNHPRRLASVCAVLMVLGSSLVLMGNLQRTGRFSDELYMSNMLPPSVRQSPDHSVGDFMQNAAKLKEQADTLRARKSKAELEDDDDE